MFGIFFVAIVDRLHRCPPPKTRLFWELGRDFLNLELKVECQDLAVKLCIFRLFPLIFLR